MERLLERLFSSRVRVGLLTLLLLSPGQSFHIRQLARRLSASYSNVRRELENLAALGLLRRWSVANRVHFSADSSHFLYHELRSIVLKTEGVGDILRESLASMGQIERAFIYGSAARGTDRASSDIDLLIVGRPDLPELEAALDRVERNTGRAVNYVLYEPAEWERRLAEMDPFLTRVLGARQITLVGETHEP